MNIKQILQYKYMTKYIKYIQSYYIQIYCILKYVIFCISCFIIRFTLYKSSLLFKLSYTNSPFQIKELTQN